MICNPFSHLFRILLMLNVTCTGKIGDQNPPIALFDNIIFGRSLIKLD